MGLGTALLQGFQHLESVELSPSTQVEVEDHGALIEAVDGLEKALSVVVLVHVAVAIANQEIPEDLGVGDVVVDKGNLEVLAHFNRSCRF